MKAVCTPLAAHTAVDGCFFSLSLFKNGNNVMEKSENLSRGSEISYMEVLWAMRFSLLMVLCRLDSTVTQCG
jgi:hypothetical protein